MGFPEFGNVFLPLVPHQRSRLFPLSFFLSFILPGWVGIFLLLLGVQGFLLVFSRCSVRTVPVADVSLAYVWGEANSSSFYSVILTPPGLAFSSQSFPHILSCVEWTLLAAAASLKRKPRPIQPCDKGRPYHQRVVTGTIYLKSDSRLSPALSEFSQKSSYHFHFAEEQPEVLKLKLLAQG